MADQEEKIIGVIGAGSKPVVEIVVSGDRQKLTIRYADDHNHKFEFMESMLGTLVHALRDAQRKLDKWSREKHN